MGRKDNTGFVTGTNAGLRIQVDAPGLEEKIAELQKFAAIGDTDARRVRPGMNQTVKLVLTGAYNTVPFRTGKLKTTLFSKVVVYAEGNASGYVGSNMRHIVPFVLEGGRNPSAKKGFLAPRRWLWHAYKRYEDQINAIWKGVLEKITQDLAKKGM